MSFVTFEGIDGSGKTTQASRLVDALRARGASVIATKEPDGGRIGKDIRAILVAQRAHRLTAYEEALLVCAARYDHVRSVIRPAIAAGKWVVCDRFVDSTFAFQSFENDVSERFFDVVSKEIIGSTMPSFTFILDIDPTAALHRRERESLNRDADPAEAHRDFDRIRRGLLEAAERDPKRCHVIDAAADVLAVTAQIVSILQASGLLSEKAKFHSDQASRATPPAGDRSS